MSRNPHKNPNPQGKGLVPVLADWQATRPAAVREKPPQALLLDWFASALVLSARFNFRPAVGQSYFLYSRAGDWQLSLVAPGEWGARSPGACLGRCEMRRDMTWTLEPDPDLEANPQLRDELALLIEGFTDSLADDVSLGEQLPAYRRDLPYYQRMLATALGASLRASLGGDLRLDAPARALIDAAGGRLRGGLLGSDQSRS